MKVTSFSAMQEEYLILFHDKPVATSPKMLFELSYFDTCYVMFVYFLSQILSKIVFL